MHGIPFTMQIDFAEICKVLREIGYKGDITLEVSTWTTANTPDELLPTLMRFMAKGADYMRKLVLAGS